MTEIRKKAIQNFLQKSQIEKYSVILLAGHDKGQVSFIAEKVQKLYLGQDAFNPMACKQFFKKQLEEYPDFFMDEVSSPSIFVKKSLMKIIEPSEKFAKTLEKYLVNVNPHCLVIIQTINLSTQSSLRKLAVSHKNIAYLACYEDDERDIMNLIQTKIHDAKKTISQEALTIFSTQLGVDHLLTHSEIDKLLLYCHDQQDITVDDIYHSVSDVSQFQLDALCDAIFCGESLKMTHKLDRALYAGIHENQIISVLIAHVLMIQNILLKTQQDHDSVQNIIENYRPLIFFKRRHVILKQCQIWQLHDVVKLIHRLSQLQRDMRSNMSSPLTVLKHNVFLIHYVAKRRIKKSRDYM